jgi:uncharacterized short protein YbdD (DUF466 family)
LASGADDGRVTDNETYVEHMHINHSDKRMMTYTKFFSARPQVHYGGYSKWEHVLLC